jgi:hypothetical protein
MIVQYYVGETCKGGNGKYVCNCLLDICWNFAWTSMSLFLPIKTKSPNSLFVESSNNCYFNLINLITKSPYWEVWPEKTRKLLVGFPNHEESASQITPESWIPGRMTHTWIGDSRDRPSYLFITEINWSVILASKVLASQERDRKKNYFQSCLEQCKHTSPLLLSPLMVWLGKKQENSSRDFLCNLQTHGNIRIW